TTVADAIVLPAVTASHIEVPCALVLSELDRRQPLFQQVERFLLGLPASKRRQARYCPHARASPSIRTHRTKTSAHGKPYRSKQDGGATPEAPRCGGGKHRHYDVDISLKNLRHHWNACSRTSAAGVSGLPSVIHSSAACAV